jgi:ribosome-associated protein
VDERHPVTPGGIVLDPGCLTWRFSRSSGPGGQHVNTSASKAELRCDLDVAGLPGTLHTRLVEALGTSLVRVTASAERSQLANRRAALERLADLIDDAAQIPPERRATRPSRSARQRRLNTKAHRAQLKRSRHWRPDAE